MDRAQQLAQAMIRGYADGAFAMDTPEGIQWFDPDPRAILGPSGLHVSRSLRRTIDSGRFRVEVDVDSESVVRACGQAAPGRDDTWLTAELLEAVLVLLRDGWVHSVSVWRDDALVGGVYGVHLHGVFFAESMFSRPPAGRDASKVALVALVDHCRSCGIDLIDCQFLTDHLASMGFEEVARDRWRSLLHTAIMTRASWSR